MSDDGYIILQLAVPAEYIDFVDPAFIADQVETMLFSAHDVPFIVTLEDFDL